MSDPNPQRVFTDRPRGHQKEELDHPIKTEETIKSYPTTTAGIRFWWLKYPGKYPRATIKKTATATTYEEAKKVYPDCEILAAEEIPFSWR